MGDIQQFLKNKVIIVGTILLLGILLVILAYYHFMTSAGSTSIQQFPPSLPTQTVTLQPKNSVLLSPLMIPPGWHARDDTRYAIAYPEDWHLRSEPAEGRDVYMTFQPNSLGENETFPIMVVQVYPVNQNSIQQRLTELSPLGLQQTAILFQGNQTIQLSGTLPFTSIAGDPQNKPVLKTYILFEKNNRLYVIDYAYYQDERAQIMQQLFDQILATLQLP